MGKKRRECHASLGIEGCEQTQRLAVTKRGGRIHPPGSNVLNPKMEVWFT